MYVVITGVSRGIGLELTRLALLKGHHVLGISRSPEKSEELRKLAVEFGNLATLKLDLLEQNAIKEILTALKEWGHVDILINNAGIYQDELSVSSFEKTFLTNSISPFFLTESLKPLLKKAQHPLSLQITSQMGSINDNTSGGAYSYRASKSALNMLFKSLALDESWLKILQVHPGWVRTDMGGDNAPLLPKDSAAGIWNLIEHAETRQSGQFVNYLGEELPW
jgi:NAD(P)-dependent dehydrogenase (short-subunit alcohol dehydrogenase family)